MKERKLYPNWFKNTLIFIGCVSIYKELSRPVEIETNIIIALCYPLLLLVCYYLAKLKKGVIFGKEKYFFNISLSSTIFFTLILFNQYQNLITKIGRYIGGNFSISTDFDSPQYDDLGRQYFPDAVTHRNSYGHYTYYLSIAIFI